MADSSRARVDGLHCHGRICIDDKPTLRGSVAKFASAAKGAAAARSWDPTTECPACEWAQTPMSVVGPKHAAASLEALGRPDFALRYDAASG